MLNHQFRLTLNGTPGQTYVLEAATNVTGPWTPISSVTLTTMTTNCVDPGATNFSLRFYRVLRMP